MADQHIMSPDAGGVSARPGDLLEHLGRSRDADFRARLRTDLGSILELLAQGKLSPLVAARAEMLMRRAHERCPYSNATRGNVDVSLLVDGEALSIPAAA